MRAVLAPEAGDAPPVRLDPGRRTAAAVGAIAVLAGLVTFVWVRSARPHSLAVSESSPVASRVPVAATTPTSAATTPTSAGPGVVVDVVGRVRHPGMYTLAPGARVNDAVIAAGGLLRGVNRMTLNLAAKVTDGQQVVVGVAGAGPPTTGGQGSASGLVDLNTATLEQLDALPGVGPVLAQHILDWRTAHGSFATVDQLRDVPGIGDVKFTSLRSRVTV